MQSIVIFIILSIISSILISNFYKLVIKKEARDFSIKEYLKNFKIENIDLKYVIIFFILYKIIVNNFSWISIVTIVPCITALILAFITDIKYMIIPDTSSIVIILSAIINLIYNYSSENLISSILGFIIGGVTLFVIDYIFKLVTKSDGFGYGDMKLLASIGLYLGYKSIIVIMILSIYISAIFSLIYLVSKKIKAIKNVYIPFGPFIVISTLIVFIVPATEIINLYFYFIERIIN